MSGLVPPDSLAVLRQTWGTHAEHEAVVTTPGAQVADGEGGFTEGPPAINTYPASQKGLGTSELERVIQERYLEEDLTIIFLPHDAVATTRSTLVLNNARKYEVVGVIPPKNLQVRKKLIVRFTGEQEES